MNHQKRTVRTSPPRKLISVGQASLQELRARLKANPEDLGKHLKWLRAEQAGINRLRLATLAGLTESTIQTVENKYPKCNEASIQAILSVFDLSLSAAPENDPDPHHFHPIGPAIQEARGARHWSLRHLCTVSNVARGTAAAAEANRTTTMLSMTALLKATDIGLTVTRAPIAPLPDISSELDIQATDEKLVVDRYAPTLSEMLYGRPGRYQVNSPRDY